jgi:hypothetical protein
VCLIATASAFYRKKNEIRWMAEISWTLGATYWWKIGERDLYAPSVNMANLNSVAQEVMHACMHAIQGVVYVRHSMLTWVSLWYALRPTGCYIWFKLGHFSVQTSLLAVHFLCSTDMFQSFCSSKKHEQVDIFELHRYFCPQTNI